MNSVSIHSVIFACRPRRGSWHVSIMRTLAWAGAQIAAWRRQSRDRRTLSRMSIRQLDDLPINWLDDIRDIKRPY
jgi:uncharacterized protein YjiS (DUF1127 family)